VLYCVQLRTIIRTHKTPLYAVATSEQRPVGLGLGFCMCVLHIFLELRFGCLIVSTSAVDCLIRLACVMICCVAGKWDVILLTYLSRCVMILVDCCGTIFVDNVRAVSDKLYAVGGYDGQERLNTVEVFDPVINRWKLVKPMLCKRR